MEPEGSLPYSNKFPPPVPILSQLDPVHTPTSHFLKIHLKIILPSMPGSPTWSLSFSFPLQNPVYASPLLSSTSYALHAPSISFGITIISHGRHVEVFGLPTRTALIKDTHLSRSHGNGVGNRKVPNDMHSMQWWGETGVQHSRNHPARYVGDSPQPQLTPNLHHALRTTWAR